MLFSNLINKHKNQIVLIICGGSTTLDFKKEIKIMSKYTTTIGVGRITHLFNPNYNLWTNNRRIEENHEFINKISDNTKLLFGSHILPKNLSKITKPYISIPYTDSEGERFKFNVNEITGFYRTSGNLAIMIAHLMGAKRIYIVGMDGHSLLNKGNQHCYGSGLTDNQSLEYCNTYDKIVYDRLRALKEFGIKFSILTPTKFVSFYMKGLL